MGHFNSYVSLLYGCFYSHDIPLYPMIVIDLVDHINDFHG